MGTSRAVQSRCSFTSVRLWPHELLPKSEGVLGACFKTRKHWEHATGATIVARFEGKIGERSPVAATNAGVPCGVVAGGTEPVAHAEAPKANKTQVHGQKDQTGTYLKVDYPGRWLVMGVGVHAPDGLSAGEVQKPGSGGHIQNNTVMWVSTDSGGFATAVG